jgi:site-specific DNA recombinase
MVAAVGRGAVDTVANVRAAVERVVISQTTIEIELFEERVADDQNRTLIIPWTPPSPYRRREVIRGEGEQPSATRPMRTKARGLLIEAFGHAHRWLDELTTNPDQTIEAIATREGQTERWIRKTLSLAFLCPSLMQVGIEGRLPRGFGVKRLVDLPLIWADQWTAPGLKAPIKT